MSRIIYLTGAGASVSALPLASNLVAGMNRLIPFVQRTDLGQLTIDDSVLGQVTFSQLRDGLLQDAEWLTSQTSDILVDVKADELHSTGQTADLYRLKGVLASYLCLEQSFEEGGPLGPAKRRVDPRYRTFFSEIGVSNGTTPELPNSVGVLTWNYDIQFELAVRAYWTQLELESIQRSLGVWPTPDPNFPNLRKPQIVRLNGMAGFVFFRPWRKMLHFWDHPNPDPNDPEWMACILKTYGYSKSQDPKVAPLLAFAFENAPHPFDNLQKAKDLASDAEILVVVGYSFPPSNRRVDTELLNAMPLLKTVYIQDFQHAAEKTERIIAHIKPTVTLFRHEADLTTRFCVPTEF